MIDPVDSKTDKIGQTYKASVDEPVMADGQTVIHKGSDVFVKLVKVKSTGELSGTPEVQLQLDRIFIGNKAYTVTSNVCKSHNPADRTPLSVSVWDLCSLQNG